jgi:hypothetical protein
MSKMGLNTKDRTTQIVSNALLRLYPELYVSVAELYRQKSKEDNDLIPRMLSSLNIKLPSHKTGAMVNIIQVARIPEEWLKQTALYSHAVEHVKALIDLQKRIAARVDSEEELVTALLA